MTHKLTRKNHLLNDPTATHTSSENDDVKSYAHPNCTIKPIQSAFEAISAKTLASITSSLDGIHQHVCKSELLLRLLTTLFTLSIIGVPTILKKLLSSTFPGHF